MIPRPQIEHTHSSSLSCRSRECWADVITSRRYPRSRRRAVRLATVAAPQTSGETLRYSASILPYAQVDLMFRILRLCNECKAGARSRWTNSQHWNRRLRGTRVLTLAHIRREDLQNQVAQAQAQLDQAVAQHTKADQDFQRAKALYLTQSLTKPDYDQSQRSLQCNAGCDGQCEGRTPSSPIDSWRRRPEGSFLRVPPEPEYRFGKLGLSVIECFYDRRYQVA